MFPNDANGGNGQCLVATKEHFVREREPNRKWKKYCDGEKDDGLCNNGQWANIFASKLTYNHSIRLPQITILEAWLSRHTDDDMEQRKEERCDRC